MATANVAGTMIRLRPMRSANSPTIGAAIATATGYVTLRLYVRS